MMKRRTSLLSTLILVAFIGFAPMIVHADITGNTYYFSATWNEKTSQVDSGPVYKSTVTGQFSINIYNITPSDLYEYSFKGQNYIHHQYSPYYDEQNDTVDFQDNRVYFDVVTTDSDNDSRSEVTGFVVYPYFTHHLPGNMFFVNPVWSLHNTEWNDGISAAEDDDTVSSVSGSASEGIFSADIVVDIEMGSSLLGNLTGTLSIEFDASYDQDGVLSTWSVVRISDLSNEEHSIIETEIQRFSRTSSAGSGVVFDSTTTTAIGLVGVAAVGGIVLGVLIGKKYWG